MLNSYLAYSMAITFSIVAAYECMDLLSICRGIKEDITAKMVVGLFTAIFAISLTIIGHSIEDKEEFKKMIIMQIAGNLAGYAEILIFVVKMKQKFKKWCVRGNVSERIWLPRA